MSKGSNGTVIVGHHPDNGRPLLLIQDHPYYHRGDGHMILKRRYVYADEVNKYGKPVKDFKWPPGTRAGDVHLFGWEDLKRLQKGEPIFLVEGEKAADALSKRGFIAVSVGFPGARDLSSLDDLFAYPENPVCISADNDEDGGGQKKAADWLEYLKRSHQQIRWLPPVSERPCGDFADLLEGFGRDEDKEARAAVLAFVGQATDGPPQQREAEDPPKTTRIRLYTATELVAMELEPVPEPIPGLFLAGHTMLSGAPKMGKSFLLESIAVGKSGGRPVLGKIIPPPGPVLWMPLEDGLRRTVNRLKQYLGDFPAPEDLTLAFDWPGLNDGGLQYIEAWLKDRKHATVLIDTGKRLWNADEDQRGNGSMADYNFIGPLTDLYRDNDAFGVTVWHDRKMLAADFFDQISATRGMTANVDGVANLSRERGSKEAKLSIGHRDGEDKAFSLHWDDMLFNWLLVEQVDVAMGKGSPRVRVLMALRKLDSELGVDPALIVAEVGDMSLSTVRNHLTDLKKEGAATSMSRGRWRAIQEEDTADD